MQVSEVVNDATSRIDALLRGMDAVMLTLDHSNVAGVYSQGKSFFCCSLANQMYIQWVATITVVALAWVAMQCAAFVLRTLDTLSGMWALHGTAWHEAATVWQEAATAC